MNWLKEHVYIATWLGLALSVILAFVRAKTTHFAQADGSGRSFPLPFSPALRSYHATFDMTARHFAE
jgi:hypothetical protein